MMICSPSPATNGPPSAPISCPATGPYLFYAGALGIHKGVDVLLDAHARLRAGGLDIPLVLAGLPRADFRIDDRSGVVVVTNVPQPAVVAAWRHAVVGVVPSVVPEGFGRVAVECLAAGTPCVVSALGGLLDVVTDGVEGLHVPPGRRRGTGLRDTAPARGRTAAVAARCGWAGQGGALHVVAGDAPARRGVSAGSGRRSALGRRSGAKTLDRDRDFDGDYRVEREGVQA